MSSRRIFPLVLFVAAFAVQLRRATPFVVAPAAGERLHRGGIDGGLKMSLATSSPGGALQFALKKPSKTLTVSLEYRHASEERPTAMDLATLSMQLRKAKIAAIWTSDVTALREFAKEQESARGDFPGPCPVVYTNGSDGLADALDAGAAAVVLGVDSLDRSPEECLSPDGGDNIIWEVSSPADVEAVLKSADSAAAEASAFLVTGEEIETTAAALPRGSVAIGAVEAMQPDGTEIVSGRALKGAGFASVLIRGAVVGDAEDLEYARFAVQGLTSKASSEFNFSGLTGSANGHFGGVAASGTNKWKRQCVGADV